MGEVSGARKILNQQQLSNIWECHGDEKLHTWWPSTRKWLCSSLHSRRFYLQSQWTETLSSDVHRNEQWERCQYSLSPDSIWLEPTTRELSVQRRQSEGKGPLSIQHGRILMKSHLESVCEYRRFCTGYNFIGIINSVSLWPLALSFSFIFYGSFQSMRHSFWTLELIGLKWNSYFIVREQFD